MGTRICRGRRQDRMGSDRDDEAGEPCLTIDGVRIPFRMEAHVTYGSPPEDDPDDG